MNVSDDIFAEIKAALASGKTARVVKRFRRRTIVLDLSDHSACYSISIRNAPNVEVKDGNIRSLEIVTDHPLLLEYNDETWESYIKSPPSDPAAFIRDLRRVTKETTQRNFRRFSTPLASLRKVVAEGGLLMTGPHALALEIERIGTSHSALIYSVPAPPRSWHTRKQIMMLGDNLIIAERFTARRLPCDDL